MPALILGLGVLSLPPSPRWLAMRHLDERCLSTLSRLRRLPPTDPRIQSELLDIQTEIVFHERLQQRRHPTLDGSTMRGALKLEIAAWGDTFRHRGWRRVVVGSGLMLFQQYCGIVGLTSLV